MTMKEFYEKYNLNKYNFASIAGVGAKSMIKFAEGESLRESTRLRIELAMRIAEENNLVRPKYEYDKGIGLLGTMYKWEFQEEVWEYEKRFKKLIAEAEKL